jgi:2-haloacid dehalogenase
MQLNLEPTPQLITFDTYGTLIDWESAIISYISETAERKGEQLDARQFYRVWYYGYALPALKGPFMQYRKLLKHTFQQALVAHRIDVEPTDGDTLGDAMAAAEPFPDAVDVLRKLKTKYRLATISNSQDDIISHAAEKLQQPFDLVITADTTHTYKPNPALFELVLARANVDRQRTVHVAQSQYVDLPRSVPMGIRTVWINRQGQKLLKETPAPDVILRDLRALPELLGV